MLRGIWLAVLAAGWAVAVGGAVLADPPERVDRGERPMRMRPPGQSPIRYLKTLDSFKKEVLEALALNEELAEEVGALFEDHVAGVREDMESVREERRENAERIRELVRELRDAQANDDSERADELRQEIVGLRQNTGGAVPDHEPLFNSVRDLLDDEQLEVFNQHAERFEEQMSSSEEGGPGGSIRNLRQALEAVQLSAEQRAQTREVLATAMRDVRSAGNDKQEVKKLEEAARDEIVELLDEQQATEFQAALKKLGSSDARRSARERRDRGARPPKAQGERPGEAPDQAEQVTEPAQADAEEAEADDPGEEEYDEQYEEAEAVEGDS